MDTYLAGEWVWFEGAKAKPLDSAPDAVRLPTSSTWFEGQVVHDDGTTLDIRARANVGNKRYTVPREAVRRTPPK